MNPFASRLNATVKSRGCGALGWDVTLSAASVSLLACCDAHSTSEMVRAIPRTIGGAQLLGQ